MSENTTKKLQSNPKRYDFLIVQILSNFSSNMSVGFGLVFLKFSTIAASFPFISQDLLATINLLDFFLQNGQIVSRQLKGTMLFEVTLPLSC